MGRVFDIQRVSVHDGPGIRTTVFLKGCPLRCVWCHNPEGLESRDNLKYLDEKCILCRSCAEVCDRGVHTFTANHHNVDFQRCNMCAKCIRECPSEALEQVGREMTAREVVEEVAKDRAFFGVEGGITLSGGEPMMQRDFVKEVFMLAKNAGINTCLDTSGYARGYEEVLPYTDTVLYDVKAVTQDIHLQGTGVGCELVKENLKLICATDLPVYIRIPAVEPYNATAAEMTRIADFLSGLDIMGVTIMPYHTLGRSKYDMVGLTPSGNPRTPTDDTMRSFKTIFETRGLNII